MSVADYTSAEQRLDDNGHEVTVHCFNESNLPIYLSRNYLFDPYAATPTIRSTLLGNIITVDTLNDYMLKDTYITQETRNSVQVDCLIESILPLYL